MLRKESLARRIISRVIAITGLLLFALLSTYYLYTRYMIRETTREYAIQLAGNVVGEIEQQLKPLEMLPQMLATTAGLGILHPDSVTEMLKDILENNEDVYGTSLAFEPGILPDKGKYFMPYAYREGTKIKTTYLGGIDYDYHYMDWYQIPAMLQKPYWSEPYFDEGAGNAIMATYSYPFNLPTPNGPVFGGIATIDVDLDWLGTITNSIKIFETGYVFLMSPNGVAVAHPDSSLVMNETMFSLAESWGEPIVREIGREMQQGISKFRPYNLKGRGKRWIYYTSLPGGFGSIAVVYPDKEMYQSLHNVSILLLILLVAGIIVLITSTTKIISKLAAPLVNIADSARSIAEGDFNVSLPEIRSRDEIYDLRNSFCYMQEQLGIYIENLRQTTTAKEKIESELRIARDIQMAMIPHSFPPFPNLPQIDLFAMLKSAKEVGGDLYDFFLIDNRNFCFAIGDVSGKGVPASLFMAVTRALLRSVADKEHVPEMILGNLNKSLSVNNDSCMFVTFFCGILNLDTGMLSFSNAGHNAPCVIRANGETEMLTMPVSIPLGIQDDYSFTGHTFQLNKGDKIFAYTDGVSEAENSSQELFGEDAIIKVIQKNSQCDPRTLIKNMEAALDEHVAGYDQSDDITMMTISYAG
jgi:sigma-B regulation protein RsbU (phosphoserine phosphatase)